MSKLKYYCIISIPLCLPLPNTVSTLIFVRAVEERQASVALCPETILYISSLCLNTFQSLLSLVFSFERMWKTLLHSLDTFCVIRGYTVLVMAINPTNLFCFATDFPGTFKVLEITIKNRKNVFPLNPNLCPQIWILRPQTWPFGPQFRIFCTQIHILRT